MGIDDSDFIIFTNPKGHFSVFFLLFIFLSRNIFVFVLKKKNFRFIPPRLNQI